MRIIKENMKEKIHKCEKCGSIYAYTCEDVDYFYVPTMKCPVCKSYNTPSIFDKKVK